MIAWGLVLAIGLGSGVRPDAWPSFRNGGCSRSACTNLPLRWSPDRGIVWQSPLPGYGQSSPVVWDGTVFVTAVEGTRKERCVVVAMDVRTGRQRWSRAFAAGTTAPSDYLNSRAAPTPAVDGSGVYTFFESGDLIALSHDGAVKWKRSLVTDYEPFQARHGIGASLAQTSDAVIALLDHQGPSYLLAVDKATGETKWKANRKSRTSWTSPIAARIHGVEQIIVSSNGTVAGYDAATGALVWEFDDAGGNLIPSPTVVGNRVLVGASPPRFERTSKAAVASLCLEVHKHGDEFRCQVLWRAKKSLCYFASPIAYAGCVYHINKAGVVSCLDMETGTPHYVKRINGPCWATPIAACGRVYFFGRDGLTSVIQAGRAFAALAENMLWSDRFSLKKPAQTSGARARNQLPRSDQADPVVYGVAAADEAFFIRTGTRLYCVRR